MTTSRSGSSADDPRQDHREGGTAPTGSSRPGGRPMRTLHVEVNEDGTVGGSHRALSDLVSTMDRSRYEPVVLYYQSNEYVERLRGHGLEVITFDDTREMELRKRREMKGPRRALEFAASVKRRYDILKRHRIDLVHMNNSPWHGCDDWFPAARLRRIPFVASAMGWPPQAMSNHPVQAWLVQNIDRILPVSQIMADVWEQAGVDTSHITVVHHGVNVDGVRARVRRTREDVHGEFEVPAGGVLVAMIGNVREWKGQHVVVESLPYVPAPIREKMVVVFAGAETERDKPYREHLNRRVEELGLGKQVRFIGFRNDVPDIMSAADVVVHASTHPEPGGIVVLESMALGTATVAAAVGGHTEVMIEGTGLTFDTSRVDQLAACLTRLAKDQELRARLGAAAEKRIREFSIERNAEETQQVYDELLNG